MPCAPRRPDPFHPSPRPPDLPLHPEPPAQRREHPAHPTADATIQFARIEFNPASGNQAEEFIELTNANAYAVDLSGWRLDGAVRHTFRPGTVIPARRSLFVSPDVRAFRARTSAPRGGQGLFVQGNYSGQLNAWGETLTLMDTAGQTKGDAQYPAIPRPPSVICGSPRSSTTRIPCPGCR
jgi:hypothetical protein